MYEKRIFAGDFETTVYEGQEYTEVWASACVELYTEEVKVFHSIGEQFDYFTALKTNVICYYHNLKFDGSFWLYYLMHTLGYTNAGTVDEENADTFTWSKKNAMKNKSLRYTISNRGQWYTIIVKVNNKYIEFRDSLKLLPFTLESVGRSFGTKHQKLSMNYKGFRYAGCPITEEELDYIKNDVLVLKEALEFMFDAGHNKLTIGACCLSEYKQMRREQYKHDFPNLYDVEIDEKTFGSPNAGEYIRKSYRGGWCYLVKGKENKVFNTGVTADVNSLYPSVMSGESGNSYPVGTPHFWKGDIPELIKRPTIFYFVRIKTRFKLKEGMLPFVQIKSSMLYKPKEMLETSDIYNAKDGKYYHSYRNFEGEIVGAKPTLTLTMMDYALLQEHYELTELEVLDGCWFDAKTGIFDEYIDKYKKIKLESKGAMRILAKLFLNNLYGKMASSTDSSFKVAYIKEENKVGYYDVQEHNKTPGYIAVGSAITSYARCFTISAAQKNFYGADKPGFIYADTDSIHCDIAPDKINGIVEHPVNFCCWKLESFWDEAIFVRAKTYIEHVTHEDKEAIEKPYYNIKCAGMSERPKHLLNISLTGSEYNEDDYNEDEKRFIAVKRELTDFKVGLTVPSKLMPKTITGGVVLCDTTFEIR